MNKKYFIDIKNKVKFSDIKTVEKLEEKVDFEAGSGKVGPSAMEMKEFDKYSIIVENVRYDIQKELFDKLKEGDDVIFYYTPASMFLLSIEKH